MGCFRTQAGTGAGGGLGAKGEKTESGSPRPERCGAGGSCRVGGRAVVGAVVNFTCQLDWAERRPDPW